jgi:hypothetical protein
MKRQSRQQGLLERKLIGTDFSDYFTDPQKARTGYQTVFEKGFVKDYELTIKHIDGSLMHVLYNANVYRDHNEKYTVFFVEIGWF